MLRSLYWRIFAAFWLAIMVVLIAFAWITTSRFENEKIPGLDITRLQAKMDDLLVRTSRELRHDGIDEGRQWLRSAPDFSTISVYVIAADGNELLGRHIPDRARVTVESMFSQLQANGDRSWTPPADGERLRARAVRTRDGGTYVAVAVLEGNFLSRLLLRRPSPFWMHLGLAMVASALVAALLAWYVAAPLTRIRESTRRFAGGDLSARVGRLRFGRSAEVVALATEFDRMAERIKALVDSHRLLVRDVSHERRSPLARLRVALELAREGDRPQVQAALDRIEHESDRLEGMLAQALELSRLETATTTARDHVELDELLGDVITNADYEGAPRGRKVVLTECERLALTGSHAVLYSAFENLIRNALAYTADGSTISVRLHRDNGHAEVRVRDHGPGVAQADLTRIFEPFYRTDAARMRSSGGTGLGLAIARSAIERHGGSIVAHNADGGGLEVVVRLPLAVQPPHAAA